MKPFPPILFLTAEYDASGRYSLSARRQNGEEVVGAWTPLVRSHIVAVVICGHGVITKPADGDIARRVEADEDTFLSSRSGDDVSFFRRERMSSLESDLALRGIVPAGRFCTAKAADMPAAAAICAERIRTATSPRRLLRPTDTSSAVLQACARRIYIPVLCVWLSLLSANAFISAKLNSEQERLRSELSAREHRESRRTADNESERALLRAFSERPSVPRAVVCDRIAAAVPEPVRLRSIDVEPPAKRFEAGKPLLRRENNVTVIGSAPSSAAVSEFVARLSASGVFRSVNLASIERERNASALDFEIDLEP